MSFFETKWLHSLLTMTLLLSLGSCMRTSDLNQNAAFLPPTAVDQSITEALRRPFFEMGNWPTSNWWESFNYDELNPLIQIALTNNPTIQSVQQKIEIAKQMAIKSKSNLFPSLFFDGDESWGHLSKNSLYHLLNPSLSQNFNLIKLNFAFNYEFDFWGKYRNLFRASLGRERAQIAEYRQVELIISTALSQAFFSLKQNLARKKLYEKLYSLKEKSLALIILLQERAILSKFDPATGKQGVDETLKVLATINEEIASNIHLINILMGQGPDNPLNISDIFSPMPSKITIPENLSSELLIRRPDLIAAIWRIEALAYEKKAAFADFFPRINLKGFLGLESIGYKHLMDWQSGGMSLLPSFHIPIFKAGEIKANLKVKKAELEEAIYDYNQLLLKSLQEVTDLLVLTTSWYEKKKIQSNILDNASLKLHLAKLRSEKGLESFLQVYMEEEMMLLKEIQDIEITYNQYISVINLIKALGGGFESGELNLPKVEVLP